MRAASKDMWVDSFYLHVCEIDEFTTGSKMAFENFPVVNQTVEQLQIQKEFAVKYRKIQTF